MSLGDALETLYSQTDFAARKARDPVRVAHRYTRAGDQEVAGLISALFAYGRVDLFGPVVDDLLDRLGPSPRDAVDAWEDDGRFEDLVYRWNRGPDVALLLSAMRRVLEDHGSLGAVGGKGSAQRIERLVMALDEAAGEGTRGFRSWMNRPSKGSACKRWAMYVRWMVRPDIEGVDLGLWDASPAELVIPVDVHVMRIAGFIGLTTRKTAGWKTAEDITRSLRRFDPVDPVRFDFAIAHLGISGLCKGHKRPECSACPLEPYCSAN